jgi:hypothetical protein
MQIIYKCYCKQGGKMKFHWFIWIPRILLILLVLFFFIVSFRVFGWQGSTLHKIKEFVIYNIPTVTLLLLLWLSKKNPLWCGILLIILGFIFTLYFRTYVHHFQFHTFRKFLNFDIRSVLPVFTGILFIIAQFLHPKEKVAENLTT